MSAAAVAGARLTLTPATRSRLIQRNAWSVAVYVILAALLVVEKIVHPSVGSFDYLNLVSVTLPLAFAAMAQTSVVLVGGVDLSIGAMMALVNVTAARWMVHADFREAILESFVIITGTMLAGALTGFVITISRVPDIIVTLATSFIWTGVALVVLPTPGGQVPVDFSNLDLGTGPAEIPVGLFVMVAILLVLWIPFRRSKLGLRVYALGSNRTAAYLSGVSVGQTRIVAYAFGGLFVGLAGLALTAYTSSGDPNSASNYTLNSVAAVVLGGVSLAGGRGGMAGPVAAAFVLTLIGFILNFLSVDPNWSTVIQGAIVVAVVLFAGLFILRRRA